MTTPPTVTTAMLAALDATIATGTLRVDTGDGKGITYQSTAQLLAARAFVADELARLAPAPTPRSSLAQFTKG